MQGKGIAKNAVYWMFTYKNNRQAAQHYLKKNVWCKRPLKLSEINLLCYDRLTLLHVKCVLKTWPLQNTQCKPLLLNVNVLIFVM